MGRHKRRTASVIDLTGSDNDEDTIRVASRKKQKRTHGTKHKRTIYLASDEENRDPAPPESKTLAATPREVFKELSSEEFQQKLKQPKAWVNGVVWRPSNETPKQKPTSAAPKKQKQTKTPVLPSGTIRHFFAKSAGKGPHPAVKRDLATGPGSVSTNPPSSVHGLSQSNDQPARRSARDAFSLIMQKSHSEDELQDSSEIPGSRSVRKAKPKPKSNHKALWQRVEDADFEAVSSSDSEVFSENEERSTEDFDSGSIEEDERQLNKEVKKKTNKKSDIPSSNAKGSGKSGGSGRAKARKMANLLRPEHGQGTGLLATLPPLSHTRDIFEDIISKAVEMGLSEAVDDLPGPLRVATMCSGTESPLLALELFQQCPGLSNLEINHLFSAEIVPFKQAYIERNFRPPIIFRDITELTNVVNDKNPMATTAYGSKVLVPKDIDLLIAGTSCVDYSKLNTHQKTIDQGGESGDTYTAVLAYCKAFRPAIVILENVLGAPWDTMLQDYEEIGYDTGGALVDTKRYYLPQTRQRGYMVCFDKHGTETSLAGAGKRWTDLMAGFRRPASSPVSSFLLPTSQSATYKHNKDDEQRVREVDWTRCELRHTALRHQLRLGNERPVTHWSESGSLLVPEGGDPTWYFRMVERVWDLLDISVLRKALPDHGFYDARYKLRIWDVSQNVDFQKDTGAFGIIGCITPTMIPFLSDAGRVLTPEELLQLQGLPLDKISFTTEAPAQIQDLAGNAMSTTVVGPAILAALIAGHHAIHGPKKKVANIQTTSTTTKLQELPATLGSEKLESVTNGCAPAGVDLEQLLSRAAQATRRCVCEAAGKLSTKPIQECARCGHTACLTCAGNPEHEYRQNATLGNERLAPNDFEMFLYDTMPLRLTFSFQDAWKDLAMEAYYTEAVNGLSQRYSFQSIRQSYCWTVTYLGDSGGRLDLVLHNGRAEWRLFADIPRTLSCNSPHRAELEKPVAIAKITNNFFGDEWRIRVPASRHIGLKIEGSTDTKASWWARNGLLDFAGHTVPEFLDIYVEDSDHDLSMLNGKYQYLPRCGTASDGLFKRTEGTLEPLFLFLDPSRIGDPNLDCFGFSHNVDRIDYHEQRITIAHIAAPWRPWDQPGTECVKPTLCISDSFKVRPQCHLTATATSLEILRLQAVDTALGQSDCTRTVQLLRASGSLSSGIPVNLTSAAAQSQFFSRQHWILEAMGRCFPSEEWRPILTSLRRCKGCAPSRPGLRWAIQKVKSKEEVFPYEDVPSAAAYEQAMKARPAPIALTATSSGENSIEINLGINVATLAHRAGARLPDAATLQFSWRLMTRANSAPFVFKRFHLTSNEDSQQFEGKTGLSVELFHQQQQSLAWMIRQEQGICFELEDTEEEFLPETGWLAQARASGTVVVRGGICADHPGFGKTILSLALISAQWTSAGQTVGELESRKPEGLHAIAATLIVCPGSLVQQWVDEINDKTGSLSGVISIMGPAQLGRYTIANFQAARIIVVNRDMLGHPAYTDRLSSFAGMPGPITTAGRPFTEWRAYATQQIPEHLGVLSRGGLSELRSNIKSKYTANMSSDHFRTAIPSRRHRGQAYVENKNKKKLTAAQQTKTAAPSVIDTSTIDQPLLEMFYFNRIIVDEFHDYGPKIYAATAALKADKRWGLSGTPAIEDFYQVSQMAKLLQVDLPIGSMDPAVMKNSSRQAIQKEMSNFEQFDIMRRKLPSASKHRSIHALHQRFLSAFARQNIGDFSEMPYREHLVPVTLDLEQQLLYTELSQHLNSLQMRIKRSGKSKPTDRTKRLHEAVSSSTSAEEALSKAAAFVDQTRPSMKHVPILDDLIHSCNANIEGLRREIKKTGLEASVNEAEKFIEWTVQMLHHEGLEDRALIKELGELLPAISSATKGTKRSKKKKEEKEDHESNESTHKLTTLCRRLHMERRSLRYLNAGKELQSNAIAGALLNMCEHGSCNSQNPSNYALSAVCGHLVCEDCYDRNKQEASTRCPAEGCSQSTQPHHLLWTRKMSNLKKTTPSPYGMKLDAAMHLLREIERKGEQAILFVQFPQQLEQAATALDRYQIRGTVVRSASEAGAQLKAFRSESEDRQTVIVLNVADETAAGSNLQNANHVIFFSPLLSHTQYRYDSTMAQALGRVRRFGQTREIHVYRVVALDTIDVDILEHREHRTNGLVEEGQPAIKPPTMMAELETRPRPERTQLVRENGHFSLRPQSWLVKSGTDLNGKEREMVQGKSRVLGWEDFSSLVKFSSKYTDDDE
ncbi:hypothetical protein BST61_g10379 [Cercospora zeina]